MRISLKRASALWTPVALAALLGMTNPTLDAGELGFLEDFALAKDRDTDVKRLARYVLDGPQGKVRE